MGLTEEQRRDFEESRGKLSLIKGIKAGVINYHGIPPSRGHLNAYKNAVGELSRRLGDLVDGVYEVYLESQGNWYTTEVGVTVVKAAEAPINDLERTMYTIIDLMENHNQRLFSDPEHFHRAKKLRRETAEQAVKNLLANDGSLEYFDRMTFFKTEF